MACLYGLLIWALSVQLADTCLCCWPDAAKYFSYDVQLLVGGNKDVVEKLEKLFLGSSGKCAIYGGRFLEREDMEREAGNLFLRLQQIVQKNEKDPERLMMEAGREKQNFSKRLEEVSGTLLKEKLIRFRPYELADCGGCRLLKAPCSDSLVCAGPNVLAGVLVTLVILLGAGAGVWYYRRKKAREGEPKAQEDDSTESSSSSWSSEWSDDTDTPNPPAEKTPNPTKANAPDPPYQNIPPISNPSTPYQNVPPIPNPSTPYQNVSPIPSPPHIWSPPS
ncbi:UNVERIFIED_CONTAM: hypothetical protein K2H54_037496 [Gekko kuhli]